MVTTTTTYSFKKPTVADDEDVWGGYLNETIDLIDDVLDGTTPVTGIDINSGTIDNVVIGGTTAAAGSFTSVTIEGSNVVFEGATADDFETTLTVTDPTADRTITFPDESGTIPLIDSSGHLIVENDDPELQLISTDTDESYLRFRKNLANDAWDMQIDGSNAEAGSSFEIAIDGSSVSSQNVTSGVSKTVIKDLLQVQGQDAVNDDANLEVNGFFGAAELSVYSGGSTSKIGIGTETPAVSLDIATTDAIQVPDGTTAQRPASPANGMFRYSTTDNQFEGYINGAWGALGGSGGGDDDAVSVTKSGSTYTLDLSSGHNFYTAADVGTDTFALSNIPTTSFEGKVEISYVGGTITWPTEFEWAGGSAPSLLSGRDHLFEFNKIRSSSKIKAIYNGPYDYTGSTTFPTFVGLNNSGSVNGGSYTISFNPSFGFTGTIAANDVAILAAVVEHSTVEPTIQSGGWTSAVVVEANDSYDARMAVYYKVLTGTETGVTVNATGDTNAAAAGVLMVFRGVDTTTPLDVTPTSNTTINSGIPEFVSVTSSTSTVGKILIGAAGSAHARGSVLYTVPDGVYEQFKSGASNDSGDVTIGMGYQLTAGASATVTPTDFSWEPASGDASLYSASAASIILRGAS
jgi:hypothetical protein